MNIKGNKPSLTIKELIRILSREGFELDRVKGSLHVYYNPSSKKRVVVPFHKKDLPKGTLRAALEQADISFSVNAHF